MNSFKKDVKNITIVCFILMAIVVVLAYKDREHCGISFIGKNVILSCPNVVNER